MKKTLLFAALLCCMMPLMAQRNAGKTPVQLMKEAKQKVEELNLKALSYTEKLDSLVYSSGSMMAFEYDQNLNCTKINEYIVDDNNMGWELYYSTTYEYDAQNHVTSILYVSSSFLSKMTMVYDNNGRVTEQHMFIQIGEDQWMETSKMTYDYDLQGNPKVISTFSRLDLTNWNESEREEYTYENGLVTSCVSYVWDDDLGTLVYDSKNEWGYDAQQRCTKLDVFDWDDDTNAWLLDDRTEYSYNNDGNLEQELSSYLYNGVLEYYYKIAYEYDDHFNAIKVMEYDYDENDWVLDSYSNINYDRNVPSSKIAGYTMVFEDDFIKFFKDKILEIKGVDNEDEEEILSFYYSAANNLNEATDLQCVVFPNPTSVLLTVTGNGLRQVDIFSMDGKLVMSLEKGLENINVSGLANGSYLLKATFTDGRMASQPFIKQ